MRVNRAMIDATTTREASERGLDRRRAGGRVITAQHLAATQQQPHLSPAPGGKGCCGDWRAHRNASDMLVTLCDKR